MLIFFVHRADLALKVSLRGDKQTNGKAQKCWIFSKFKSRVRRPAFTTAVLLDFLVVLRVNWGFELLLMEKGQQSVNFTQECNFSIN